MKSAIFLSFAVLALSFGGAAVAFADDAPDLHNIDYSKLETKDPVKTSYVPGIGYADPRRESEVLDIHALDYTATTSEPVKTSYQIGKGYL